VTILFFEALFFLKYLLNHNFIAMVAIKCHVPECASEKGSEKDEGVTFHRFPQTNASNSDKWKKGNRKKFHNFAGTLNFFYLHFSLSTSEFL
jgi:hypothetical protein